MKFSYYKQHLSIGMKCFIASGVMRISIIIIILLFLWVAIFWSFMLP